MTGRNKTGLLASSSLCALLLGVPTAWAGSCTISVINNPASGAVNNAGAINCINIQNSTITGNVSNSGTLNASGTIAPTATGITLANHSTINGSINDSGTITASSHGILIDATSKVIAATLTAVKITGPTFTGGISNAGTISALTGIGIVVHTPTTFSGGISNSGTISALSSGIAIHNVTTFSGGISNSGTMLAKSGAGIQIFDNGSFFGGVSNSGMISAGGALSAGIQVARLSTFSGGVSNSGTIISRVFGIQVGTTTAAGRIFNFSGNVSNSGTISARTGIAVGLGVTFAPGSAIINSGTIIGTTAAIDVSLATSAVTINQTGGSISGAIKLSANADVLNISGGTIAGNIIGQGSINTINFALGSGTFTYGSAFGFSGINQVNVDSGTVILDGTNSATNVKVNGGLLLVGDPANPGATLTSTTPVDVAAGTLAGHGIINGGVIVQNGATLMPGGGTIGTLTINGNLSLASGSTYGVEFSSTQASRTQINGAATLGGATVNAIIMSNQFGLHTGNTYTILTATTPLGAGNTFNPNVTFSGLTPSETLLLKGTASLSYDANDVFLTVPNYAIGLATPVNASLNAQNVVGGINTSLLAGNTLPAGFQNLANLSGNALGNALNQLAGQSQGSFGPVGFEAGNQFLNIMLDPYIDGRPGFVTSTSSPPLAYASQQSSAPAANAFNAVALGPRAFFEPRLNFWASAYGGDGRISGSTFTGAANTNSQIYGVATGVDYLALPNTIFGLALGGGGTAWQLGQGMGTGHSDMFQAGLYGRSQLGPAYVAGAFAYSLHDVTTNRNVTLAGFDSLQGNFAADVLSMRLEGGYRLPYGVVAVTPYGAVQSQDMFLPAYSEFATSGSSQFALNYTNRNFTATRTEIGAWFDSDALMANGIKLYGRLAWAHDFDNEGASFAFFQSLPGSNFLVNSAKPARDGALTTAGFEYKLADGWSILGKFDGEFSSTTAIFAGTGTIKKVW